MKLWYCCGYQNCTDLAQFMRLVRSLERQTAIEPPEIIEIPSFSLQMRCSATWAMVTIPYKYDYSRVFKKHNRGNIWLKSHAQGLGLEPRYNALEALVPPLDDPHIGSIHYHRTVVKIFNYAPATSSRSAAFSINLPTSSSVISDVYSLA